MVFAFIAITPVVKIVAAVVFDKPRIPVVAAAFVVTDTAEAVTRLALAAVDITETAVMRAIVRYFVLAEALKAGAAFFNAGSRECFKRLRAFLILRSIIVGWTPRCSASWFLVRPWK